MGAIEYYWQQHVKHVRDNRLVWYAEPADQAFWHEHWKERLNTDYFEAAGKAKLNNDELGRILIHELSPSGLHLEAGCGAGYWVAALRGHGFSVDGIEYSNDLVQLVNTVCPELDISYGNALALDYEDNTYDSYLSFGVVEHREDGPEPFLAEAIRVLKPGGKLVISVPFFGPIRQLKSRLSLYQSSKPSLPMFQYGFSIEEFTSIIEQAGFVVNATHALYAHRLLVEEVEFYRWLSRQRGSRFIKKIGTKYFQGKDGHMLLIVGQKPQN